MESLLDFEDAGEGFDSGSRSYFCGSEMDIQFDVPFQPFGLAILFDCQSQVYFHSWRHIIHRAMCVGNQSDFLRFFYHFPSCSELWSVQNTNTILEAEVYILLGRLWELVHTHTTLHSSL